MLRIRAEVIEGFRAAAVEDFIHEMTLHLEGFAPEVCKTLGRERLRAAARVGMTRAEGYGFTYRGPIRLFLESMFILGSGFDNDPQYPWAGETLRAQHFFNQMFKAGRLEHLVREYVTQVSGPDNELSRQALLRLEEVVTDPDLTFQASTLKADILAMFGSIFPSKLRFIGQDAAEQLVDQAEEQALRVFGADNPRGVAVMAVLGFSFGAGFAHDPLLPWIGVTLQEERFGDAATRARRLEQRAILWLKAVNRNLGATSGAAAREVET